MTDDGPAGTHPIETELDGTALLTNPMLNKGTAFTEEERTAFALHGLLPPHIGTLEVQVSRRLQAVRKLGSDLDRYVFLRGLQDANETLFYALLTRHLEEMLPLVYTPTVGAGCQSFSHYWHYPRGLFLSWPHRDRIKEILAHPRFDNVEAVVVSDGERILGLGDQGRARRDNCVPELGCESVAVPGSAAAGIGLSTRSQNDPARCQFPLWSREAEVSLGAAKLQELLAQCERCTAALQPP